MMLQVAVSRMYELVRKALFNIDAERAHNLGLTALQGIQRSALLSEYMRRHYTYRSPRLSTTVAGIELSNPVGLAAGFDKNAVAVSGIAGLGFGFVEVGTVTPRPQRGNPKPRMFRLPENEALVNRLGFNNDGMLAVRRRLENRSRPVPVGVNIGKMNSSTHDEGLVDYAALVDCFGSLPTYYTVNVSCPNTNEEYDEQEPSRVEDVLQTVLNGDIGETPVFVKVGPDEDEEALERLAAVTGQTNVDGIVATNTTSRRPDSVDADGKKATGGLSGRPLHEPSNSVLQTLYKEVDVPLIGVGGVVDGETAYNKIRLGASAVQLYTGLIYNGPTTVRNINRELEQLLANDGYDTIDEAVGVDA